MKDIINALQVSSAIIALVLIPFYTVLILQAYVIYIYSELSFINSIGYACVNPICVMISALIALIVAMIIMIKTH
jgi:hypothetical protein